VRSSRLRGRFALATCNPDDRAQGVAHTNVNHRSVSFSKGRPHHLVQRAKNCTDTPARFAPLNGGVRELVKRGRRGMRGIAEEGGPANETLPFRNDGVKERLAAMKCIQLKVLSLAMAMGMPGWSQGAPEAAAGKGPQDPPAPEASQAFPFDVAGYISFRYLNDDAFQEHDFFREYAASLFLSKTVGRWRFHAEFNADTAPEYDSDGIHLFPPRPSLSVKLDSAFVNYNSRDWLQVQAGLLFVPTYWRRHRYQSTTLTVAEPLIDQNIFPTALKGGALYGDKYWGDGGLSYIVYGGVDQQSQFQQSSQVVRTEQAKAAGAKITLHVPNRQFFTTFDVSVHRLHRVGTDDGKPDELYGTELQLSKSRFELLGEFDHASMDVVNGIRAFVRQGYYIQPSYRITAKLFAVVRLDRLDRDSRYTDQSRLARQSAGLTYRPVPAVSLKIEGDRYEPQGTRIAAYYGVTAAAVWFFQLP
jgi:hypothetical protein